MTWYGFVLYFISNFIGKQFAEVQFPVGIQRLVEV
jgi:hypothetical protein